MSYNINDLKSALEKNDKLAIVAIIKAVFNTIDEKHKELEAKDKLIGELKAALLDAIGGMAYIKAFHGELYGVGFDRIEGYRLLTKGESNE